MALLIKDNCIKCDPECPNDAITSTKDIYQIDPILCTECVGYYDTPTCGKVCPINCIIVDPAHIETMAQLLQKFAIIEDLRTPFSTSL